MKEFVSKRSENKLEIAKIETIEDKLSKESVSYAKLPKITENDLKIGAKPKVFTNELSKTLKNVKVELKSNTILTGKLDQPFQFDEEPTDEQIETFLADYVIDGDQYVLVNFNESKKEAIFFQQYDDKIFFNNDSATLKVNLDANLQATGYVQTMLSEIKTLGMKQPVIPALNAIETLLDKGYILSGCKITGVELGYFTLVPTTYQVLEPTWRIVTDDGKVLFVTAFESDIHELQKE